MSAGLYSLEKKDFSKVNDLKSVIPYGDTMNDGKVQLSFTLPVEDSEKACAAAIQIAKKMGLFEPGVVYHKKLDEGFTFFIVYGTFKDGVDYTAINVPESVKSTMSMDEIDDYIKKNIKRKMVVIGASTGTDAHTVGIDAIMNMKGYAGHYGLERYKMIEAFNMGSQVDNEDFIKKAKEMNADALLVSQTVTQKNIHIQNLTNLVELLEAEGMREKIVLVCGGARITNELAKELGYDAGFGPNTFAEDVGAFISSELVRRKLVNRK